MTTEIPQVFKNIIYMTTERPLFLFLVDLKKKMSQTAQHFRNDLLI